PDISLAIFGQAQNIRMRGLNWLEAGFSVAKQTAAAGADPYRARVVFHDNGRAGMTVRRKKSAAIAQFPIAIALKQLLARSDPDSVRPAAGEMRLIGRCRHRLEPSFAKNVGAISLGQPDVAVAVHSEAAGPSIGGQVLNACEPGGLSVFHG